MKKEDTWDISTITNQLLGQLTFMKYQLLSSKDPKDLVKIIKSLDQYKTKIQKYTEK
tara:strand:- start:6235 stop:6405 length:171 start_codon:yes stop_codon:yes gene_type:complete